MSRSAVSSIVGLCSISAALLVFAVATSRAAEWQFANWEVQRSSGGAIKRAAPIRNLIRSANGSLLGTRSTGSTIQLLRSTNEGKDWSAFGTVAQSSTAEYGDPTLYKLASGEILAGYRQRDPTLGWSVRVSRSLNNGQTWSSAGTIEDWTNTSSEFVGAPQFLQLSDGSIQVYYDSELAASGGNQYIAVKTGSFNSGTSQWTWNNQRVVNTQPVGNTAVRDGLATVVNLGADLDGVGDRVMVVTEGIGRLNGRDFNNIRAFQVQNGGATQADWNALLDSRVIYESPAIDPSGHRYNAYAPYALRVGGGPVVVAFSTDESLDPFNISADLASTPPDQRHSEIKLIQTTTNFESWSNPITVWGLDHDNFNGSISSGDIFNYQIGLMEVAPNDLLATLDLFGGNQIVLRPSLVLHGDYNGDNIVDAADYVLWRNALGSSTALSADGSNNGVVDAADYEVWRANFGSVRAQGQSASIPVPEVNFVALLLIGPIAFGGCRAIRKAVIRD